MFAFEITRDDVEVILSGMGFVGDVVDEAERLYGALNLEKIEKAALYGIDMDDQTDYAYKEIQEQIKVIYEAERQPKISRVRRP